MHSRFVMCVPMRRTIIARPEPTIFVSCPAIVKIFSVLRVRVWIDLKYLYGICIEYSQSSLSIEFVVQLSTRHISSFIGLT
jgi:hypothetical protein